MDILVHGADMNMEPVAESGTPLSREESEVGENRGYFMADEVGEVYGDGEVVAWEGACNLR